MRSHSQSRSISSSSSFNRRGSFIDTRAAATCSSRMISTVMLKSGWDSPLELPLIGVKPKSGVGDDDRDDRLRTFGLVGGLWLLSLPYEPAPNRPLDTGVAVPDAEADAGFVRFRASEAARRSKFVVPRALVDPERAEQTMATLLSSI